MHSDCDTNQCLTTTSSCVRAEPHGAGRCGRKSRSRSRCGTTVWRSSTGSCFCTEAFGATSTRRTARQSATRCGRIGSRYPAPPLRRVTSAAPALKLSPNDGFAMKKLRIVLLRFGTRRQKMALERWTTPKLSRRTCSPRYGLQSWRGKSAGVAKRPRELVSPPGFFLYDSTNRRTAHVWLADKRLAAGAACRGTGRH
jgi:hypothetical protein